MATVVMPEIGNNGITLLNGGINASVTTVNVDSAAALTLSDSTSDSYITVIDQTTFGKNPFSTPETQEIMRVTGVSTNALTVVRGVDGTSGTEFADNSYVMLRNNAATLQRVYDALTDGNDTLSVGGVTVGGSVNTNIVSIKQGALHGTTYIDLNNTHTDQFLLLGINGDQAHIGYDNGDSLVMGKFTNANSTTITPVLTLSSGSDATFAGDVDVGGDLTVPTKTPSSASATGTVGTIAWDASYIYICVATNTWERAAIASW